jgi:hypothetical protein
MTQDHKNQILDRIDETCSDLMKLRQRISANRNLTERRFAALCAGLIAIQTQLGQTSRVMNTNYEEEENLLD